MELQTLGKLVLAGFLRTDRPKPLTFRPGVEGILTQSAMGTVKFGTQDYELPLQGLQELSNFLSLRLSALNIAMIQEKLTPTGRGP